MTPEAVQATAEAEQGFAGQPVQEGVACIGNIDEILAIAHVMIGWFGCPAHSDTCELKPKAGISSAKRGACHLAPDYLEGANRCVGPDG